MSKLNQVLAIEKGTKSRNQSTITKLYHQLQKKTLFSGLSKVYSPLNEDGPVFPPERQKVQLTVGETLKVAKSSLEELLNVTAQKDEANCNARANVLINGKILLEDVPVTYLLFLEKQLVDIKALVEKLPTLDTSEDWHYDEAASVWKSEPMETTRTQKVQEPLVLYPATPEHPAQTQLVTRDVIIGKWTTVKQSGAIPADKKTELLERVFKLLKAVKFAREEANSAEVVKLSNGSVIMDYLLG